MKRQRNIFQTKLQDKTPERGLNETDISNLYDKAFKVKIINIFMDLQKNTQFQGGPQQKDRRPAEEPLRAEEYRI